MSLIKRETSELIRKVKDIETELIATKDILRLVQNSRDFHEVKSKEIYRILWALLKQNGPMRIRKDSIKYFHSKDCIIRQNEDLATNELILEAEG